MRFAILALTLLGAGCGALCNSDNVCATTGPADSDQVCDGSNFKSCDDSNRGQTIACPVRTQRAVCTPSGWSIENNN